METTIKEISLDLGTSGSYDGVNRTFGTLQTIFNEPSMSYKSGKVIDITVVVSGSTARAMDLLFFPNTVTVLGNQNDSFDMSLSDLQSCTGRVRVANSDFVQIGGSSIANLYNINMTFNSNKLYVLGVLQEGGEINLPATGGVYLTLGYELGQSSL